MQASKISSTSTSFSAPCKSALTCSQGAPLRRRRVTAGPARQTSCSAFGGSLSSAADTISTLSQVVTTVSLAAGAWYLLGKEAALEQDQSLGSSQPCPRCDGLRYEPCVCQRWSDGDSGCASCSKTGYMPCRSCRGGGTAVPLLSTVRKEQPGSRS